MKEEKDFNLNVLENSIKKTDKKLEKKFKISKNRIQENLKKIQSKN